MESAAIIALSRQIASQQAEIERLERELAKLRKPLNAAETEDKRIQDMMEAMYEADFKRAYKKALPRIRSIREQLPGFDVVNDCI